MAKYDFKNRYYGSYLGVFWALLNPVVRLFIYFFIFGVILNLRSPDLAFYMFSGLIFWGLFTEISTKGLTAIKSKKYLIENIGVSKLDIFHSTLVSALLGFLFSVAAFFLVWIFSGREIGLVGVLYLPVWIINMALFGFGFSLIICVISSYIKDFEHVWSLVIMLGLWLNPIIIPIEEYNKFLPLLRYYNPIAGLLINLRTTLMYNQSPDFQLLFLDFGLGFLCLFIGLLFFAKFKNRLIENYDVKQ